MSLLPFASRINFCANLEFIQYHLAFANVDVLCPLVDDTFKHDYFTDKLTSSVSYGMGYNLYFVCHEKLQSIYGLKNCFVYTDPTTDMMDAFERAFSHILEGSAPLKLKK